MKKKLLFGTALLLNSLSFGQFTQANEPAIGESLTMHVCDTNANFMETTVGMGVTWDYSSLPGIFGDTRLVQVVDATMHPQASSFSGAVKAIEIQNSITTFFSSSSTDRTSYGFSFNDQNMGDVIASYSTDQEILMNYPFVTGNTVNDVFSGNLSFTFNGLPVNEVLSGEINATVDGQGTLMLPGGVTLTNVLRYALLDSSRTTVPLLGDIDVIRTQYEYYDHADQNLPVLIFSKIRIQSPGATQPINEIVLVLSKYQPTEYLSLEENELSFNVYPNPVKEQIKISGDFLKAMIDVVDQKGRTIKSIEIINGELLNVSDLEKGIYFLRLKSEDKISVKKFVKL